MGKKSSRQLWADKLAGKNVASVAEIESMLAPQTKRVPFRGVVMGIDPSLRATGIAVLDFQKEATLLGSLTIANHKSVSRTECLGRMVTVVNQLLEEYPITHVACEETIYVQNFQTAQVLGLARGALLGAVAARGLPIFDYSPLRIKQAVVGVGRASKEQVAKTMRSLLGLSEVLSFDEADAAAVAMCHAFTYRG